MTVIAWTGGSTPPDGFADSPQAKCLVDLLVDEAVRTYTGFWGSSPDEDTMSILRNRAVYDAWATLRGPG